MVSSAKRPTMRGIQWPDASRVAKPRRFGVRSVSNRDTEDSLPRECIDVISTATPRGW
jgi:hypothetical protein